MWPPEADVSWSVVSKKKRLQSKKHLELILSNSLKTWEHLPLRVSGKGDGCPLLSLGRVGSESH